MESDSVLQMYERSVKEYGLRYRPFIGDGDSSSFSTVEKSMPYGPLCHIEKAECTNHVTKRMGTALRRLLKNTKGTSSYQTQSIGCSETCVPFGTGN